MSHRFCLKYIQSLPKRASTLIVETMANVFRIDAYIEKRQLLLFGRPCRLNCSKLAKNIFIERLYQHINEGNNSTGPVADMCEVLRKYGLFNYVVRFTAGNEFSGKSIWNKIVGKSVSDYECQRHKDFATQNNRLSQP